MSETINDDECAGSPVLDRSPAEPIAGEEYVRWAYRLLLGREPENLAAIENNPFKNDRQRLVQCVLNSDEFKRSNSSTSVPLGSHDLSDGFNVDEIQRDVDEALNDRFDEVALLRSYQRLDRTGRACVLTYLRKMPSTRLTRPWDEEPVLETTQADIAILFRLILGRKPSGKLEWRGHVDNVGQEVASVIRRYLTSLEFARRGLLQPHIPEAIVTTSLEGFAIYAARDDRAIGIHILAGSYEPDVTAVFRRYLHPRMNVVDVGANIGYFTMLAASIVGAEGMVTAVEANPDNAKLIEASRRLNGFKQIRIANVATGKDMGILSLNTDYSNGITSEIVKGADLWAARIVPCIPLRQLIPCNRKLDFIKIDVEGAEYRALLGLEDILRRDRPVIVSEFSPGVLPGISGVSGEVYLRFLVGCGLRLAVIRPSGETERFGSDVAGVIRAWEATEGHHIDIVASPPSEI